MADHFTMLDKFKSPRVSVKILARERLIAQLNLARDVTVVVAPAGFGKSVLLTSWAAQCSRPTAWLALDATDNDMPTFVRDLALAIETQYPDGCRATLSLANALHPPSWVQLADSLLMEIGDLPEPMILVLDDFHRLNTPHAGALIAKLVDNSSPRLRLVISSRSEPLLPLARWRLAGCLGELRSGAIRFYPAEARELLSLFLNAEVPPKVGEAIAARTEGWAAGLRLAALSLEGRHDLNDLPEDWLGRNRHIIDYLMDEVFSSQVSVVQEFLLKSSILDWMSEPMVATMMGAGTGRSSGDVFSLPQLVAAGLFVDLIDEGQGIYRYHELFRDLLRQRLASSSTAEEIAALHRKVSKWFADKGLFEDAVHHALAAGDTLGAARVVEENMHALLDREDKTRLQFLLDLLPSDLATARAPLMIARAWIMHFESRYPAYAPLLTQADEQLQQPDAFAAKEGRAWRGHIAALRGEMLFWQGKGLEALKQETEAVAAIPSSHHLARGNAILFAGLSQHVIGHTAAAIEYFRESLAPAYSQSIPMNMRSFLGLCTIYIDSLNVEQLRLTAEMMLRQASAGGLAISRAWAHLFLGRASYEWNDLETAQFHFLAGASLRQSANAVSSHDCLTGLALTYAAQGLTQRADESAEILINFDSDPPAFELLMQAHSLRARLALAAGSLDSAKRWLLGSELPRHLAPTPLAETAVVTRGRVLLALKTHEGAQQALELAQRLRQAAMSISSTLRIVQALVMQALALERLDDEQSALDVLQEAIALAEPGGLLRTFVDFGPALGGLLARLSKSGVVTQQGTASYLVRLLAAFPAAPDESPTRQSTSLRSDLSEPLTRREVEVLELLALRLTNQEIADTLVISPFTVRRHLENISDKIGVRGRRALVERARRLELIASPSA
jgi:LuxR family transcriptional regulator, maltose regulon positive regulatory protein